MQTSDTYGETMVLKTMVPLPEISGHGYFHKNI